MQNSSPEIWVSCSVTTGRKLETFVREQGGGQYLRRIRRRNPVGFHGDFGVALAVPAALAFLKLLIDYAKTRQCRVKIKKDGSREVVAPNAKIAKELLQSELHVEIRRKRKARKR